MRKEIITNQKKSLFGRLLRLFVLSCFTSVGIYAQGHKTDFEFTETVSASLRKTMQNNVGAVFGSIHDSYFLKKEVLNISRNHATQEAIEQIQALWSTSRFYCTETGVIAQVSRSPRSLQVRNIPVFFEQGGTKEDQYQDIVIEFEPEGKISDVYIAIPMHQYRRMFETASGVIDIRRRELIVNFVEDFRTAYNLKDINYLTQVFSKDALIITGKVLKSDGVGLTTKTVQDKIQYLENLKRVFTNNQYINIKFSDIEVSKPYDKDYVYCVRLVQDWNSSNYSDKGWLFLIIDFKNENAPKIWVRAWDPFDTPLRDRTGEGDFDI